MSLEATKATAVIGGQWGDEAKGKRVHILSEGADIIVRYNGVNNAGHKIVEDGKTFMMSQFPSGIIKPGKIGVIASGSLVAPGAMMAEELKIRKNGVTDVLQRTRILTQASLVQPGQRLRDALLSGIVGTTKKGTGPGYEDRAGRMHCDRPVDIRMGRLLEGNLDAIVKMMRDNWEEDVRELRNDPAVDSEDLARELAELNIDQILKDEKTAMEMLLAHGCITKDTGWVLKQMEAGKNVLLESAQSPLLGPFKGIAPYITSSDPSIGGAISSVGIPPQLIGDVHIVTKAFPTRVGYGPFFTEFGGREQEEYCMAEGGKKHNRAYEQAAYGNRKEEMKRSKNPMDLAAYIRLEDLQYGGVTERPRREGEFDAVPVAAIARENGANKMHLAMVDSLKHLEFQDAMRVSHKHQQEGRDIDYLPTNEADARATTPVYKEYPVLKEDISHMRHAAQLPESVRRTLHGLEQDTGVEIDSIGVGPGSDQIIYKQGSWLKPAA
jgi:adenylosuccinate synthase